MRSFTGHPTKAHNGANSTQPLSAQAVFNSGADRFDSVEGLSGWNHNDVLTGRPCLVPPAAQVRRAGNRLMRVTWAERRFDQWLC
jgi:hypothetical protein